jgi:predicted nucleotidyltransferase
MATKRNDSVRLSGPHNAGAEGIPPDPMFARLAKAFFRRKPELKAVVFFGSRAYGDADPRSDYDVLLIHPQSLDIFERARLAVEVGRRLKVPVEVTATSPRGVIFQARLHPWFHAWLEASVVIGDPTVVNGNLPPVAREGCLASLTSVEIELEEVQPWLNQPRRAKLLYRMLRQILITEAYAREHYNYAEYKRAVAKFLGPALMTKLRAARPRLRKRELDELERRVVKRLRRAKRLAEAMPPNESDDYLLNIARA